MGNFEKCITCKPPKRHPGCQDNCPHYKEGKAKIAADKAIKRAEGKIDSYVRGSVIRMKRSKSKGINHHAK